MPRYCFQLQVKPDRIAEYRERHAAVWPDMLRALAETGWHNYSLFLRPDGLLIGYVESADLAAAQAAMDATEVNARWQAEMAEFFEALDVPPDQGFVLLEEVFHLEDQLAALDTRPPRRRTTDDDRPSPTSPAGSRAWPSRSRRGPTATPAPGSRCSARPAPRAPSRRRSPTPRPCTGSPAWPRRSRCTSRGTWSTTTPSCAAYAEDHGVALGTVNSNTFQDDDYKLGSLTNADPAIRRKAVQHNLDCIEVMNATGSRDLKIWLADGTNYPGQADIRDPPGLAGRGPRRDLRPDRRRPAAGAGVQVLRAGVLPHRRAGLGHVVRALRRPRRPRRGLPRHRPPRARHQHRVHRRPAAAGSGSSARSTSTAASTPTTT